MRAFERAIAVDKPEKTLSEMYSDMENISKWLIFTLYRRRDLLAFANVLQLLRMTTRVRSWKTAR